TPRYFTSLGGNSNHWTILGANAIYSATPTGFRIYITDKSGATLTPAIANSRGWHINWLGVPATTSPGISSLDDAEIPPIPDQTSSLLNKVETPSESSNRHRQEMSNLADHRDRLKAQVWYQKGKVLEKLNRTTEADEAFDKARELGYAI
ncbi:MAG: tetratricopeptide repeat protein, partial [Methanothrix sp.]